MTITTTDVRVTYTGDGTSTDFAVPFPFYGADEIAVYQTTGAGVQTTLLRGSDYTITGGNGGLGTVVMTAAPTAGYAISILRSTVATQQVAFAAAGPFPGSSFERALDRLAAIAQENQAGLLRTLRVPAGEAAGAALLPAAVDRANKFLVFDASGQPAASALSDGSVPVSAAMTPVLNAATIAAARLLIGSRQHVDAVKDGGVDNTGTTDAAAALNAAIAGMTSGVLYLRPGAYKIGSDITMKPGVVIVGEDPLLTTLIAGANNVKLLKYAAPSLQNHFTVRRIGFSNGGYSGVRGVSLDGTDSAKRCSLINLEDLYMSGLARGVDLRFCANSFLDKIRNVASATAIYIDNCADTEVMGGSAQSGTGWGIDIVGGGGAFDEGIRISHFTSNGQAGGVRVTGQDFGQITGCSFTTASLGALAFLAATNWKVANGDFYVAGGTPANPGISADSSCAKLQLTGNLIGLNTFGINLLGTNHTVTGNTLEANSGIDINLQCTRSTIKGNVCTSTGAVQSINEQASSDYNNISGNTVNGTIATVGANTKVNGDNVVY